MKSAPYYRIGKKEKQRFASAQEHCKERWVARSVTVLHNGGSPVSMQAIATSAAARQRSLLVLLFAGFVLTGIAITLAGPLLPVFIARWSLDDSRAGIFFAVQFSASLAGVWISSALTHYFGFRTSLVLGYLLMAAGLATVNASTLAAALVAMGAIGTGYGLVVPGTNLSAAEIGGSRSASLVSLVNFAWGAGAVSCSPLAMLALKTGHLAQLLLFLAGFGCLLAITFLFTQFPGKEHETAQQETNSSVSSMGLFATIVLAALFFLYVGVESSVGNWSAALAQRVTSGAAGMSTLAPMFFYSGLMTARAFAPLILRRIREYSLVLGALTLVAVGILLVILSPRQNFIFVGDTLAGLGCATIFPIYVSWLSRWYGARARRLSGLMFSMSSLGASAVPWFVGFVSTRAGSLRVGLLVPLSSALFMILLLLLLRRQTAA